MFVQNRVPLCLHWESVICVIASVWLGKRSVECERGKCCGATVELSVISITVKVQVEFPKDQSKSRKVVNEEQVGQEQSSEGHLVWNGNWLRCSEIGRWTACHIGEVYNDLVTLRLWAGLTWQSQTIILYYPSHSHQWLHSQRLISFLLLLLF